MVFISTLAQWAMLCHSALATAVRRGISVPQHKNNTCVNSPHNRQCWRDGFDIDTDYEVEVPRGRLREYTITATQELISPDGYEFKGTVFNGQYPGPLIEADWGDTLRITIVNNLANNNGTAVHFHGIRQYKTNWYDGVPGVTQCPSKPGTSQTVEFRALQYGTSWYHSHFSLQYTNGLYGPLVIHGPSSANWDVDLGPWLLADWYHDDAFKLYYYELFTTLAPIPKSVILNGKGIYHGSDTNDTHWTGKSKRFETVFQKGTKYKIGLAHTGTLLTETFWIDGHNFTVISTDFVAIKPYVTDVINIGIGQRYEIIVEANANLANGTNFWIHSQYCLDPVDPEELPDLVDSRLGIIRYRANDTRDPYTPPAAYLDLGCADPDPKDLVPVVPRQVGNRINGQDPKDYLKIGLEAWPNASDPNSRIHRWVLRNVPMNLDWKEPSLKKVALDKGNLSSLFPPETEPYILDYATDDWVYFVILNNYTVEDVDPPRILPQSVHPIHLHGHDFVILAQGYGEFTPDIVPQLDNPARRDVANVPVHGYLWIGFQVNNPGAWLMHCHIAWHASDGLAIQFIEQPSKFKKLVQKSGIAPEFSKTCADWKTWYDNVDEKQDTVQEDSGI